MYVDNFFFFKIKKRDLGRDIYLIQATDKYRKTIENNVRQLAIVLLNPGRSEGSLARQPKTYEEQHDTEFWSEKTVIYQMGKQLIYSC